MKYFKYFLQYLLTITCFIIFKFLGPKISSNLSGRIFEKIGPFFRSKIVVQKNIKRAIPDIKPERLRNLTRLMWNNYGRVFAEFMFIKEFRYGKLAPKIKIQGHEILEEIKNSNKQVVFVSGHFSNFELMAMYIEKNGIKLSSIYRPLNNIFLNGIMERIRKKYICRYQIKKGIGGLKKLLALKKNNFSTALMIDQRVSEGTLSELFNKKALTTTIPAQLVRKFNVSIVPVYIERIEGLSFRITIYNPLDFPKKTSIENITKRLNQILEKMILKKPEQWIWSHNWWK